MRIIQIADLHIGEEIGEAKRIAQKLTADACAYLAEEEDVALCICGDIIDKGAIGNADMKYQNANEVLAEVINTLKTDTRNVEVLIIPGNHDICEKKKHFPWTRTDPAEEKAKKFEKFCNFARALTGNDVYTAFLTKDAICIEFSNINWILCNTAGHGDSAYGQVDVDAVKGLLSDTKRNLILSHHTLLSDDSKDISALRNGYRLITEVQNKPTTILHGHVHGFRCISVGEGNHLVGVGPFLKSVDDVNKQMNIIELTSRGVYRVINLFYRGDMGIERVEHLVSDKASYSEGDLDTIVRQVQEDARHFGVKASSYMHNVTIRYRASFEDFKQQISGKTFEEPMKKAVLWQENSCPKELHFNHGSRISQRNSKEFLVQMLNGNPTSRRALITLIDQDEVQRSQDGYLPSFDLVQFSFQNPYRKVLNISLYMRSLEVSKFLPVNLCELFLLLQDLEAENIVAENIDITIFTHCVSYIENFDAFEKANIDSLQDEEFNRMIRERRFAELYELLKEKSLRQETVIHMEGVLRLQASLNRSGSDYLGELTNRVENLIKAMRLTAKRQASDSGSHSYFGGSGKKGKLKSESPMEKAYARVFETLRKLMPSD